jgi:hypothetical protein
LILLNTGFRKIVEKKSPFLAYHLYHPLQSQKIRGFEAVQQFFESGIAKTPSEPFLPLKNTLFGIVGIVTVQLIKIVLYHLKPLNIMALNVYGTVGTAILAG